jgi:hypothetical protein
MPAAINALQTARRDQQVCSAGRFIDSARIDADVRGPVRLGADPEFVLEKTARLANQSRGVSGKPSCDGVCPTISRNELMRCA